MGFCRDGTVFQGLEKVVLRVSKGWKNRVMLFQTLRNLRTEKKEAK